MPLEQAPGGLLARPSAQSLDHARHALRLEQALPLLELIHAEVEAARGASLPASALGRAAQYTLTLWPKLTRFKEYPELELSNNLAENESGRFRGVCLVMRSK